MTPAVDPIETGDSSRFRTSLNAYSFNPVLRPGSGGGPAPLDLFGLLEFCARHGFDAIDPTGYYVPGYPEAPADAWVDRFRERAADFGLRISGTGIRNDFAASDRAARRADRILVRKWIEVAARMGAPVIRVFSGHEEAGTDRREVLKWMSEDLHACAEIGREHGLRVGVQNHRDFLMTAEQTLELVRSVDHDWFGVILDTGSFGEDPYAAIERVLPHALSFQVKERTAKGSAVCLDLDRFVAIITDSAYRGFLPIETLPAPDCPYDPFVAVPAFHDRLRASLAGLG